MKWCSLKFDDLTSSMQKKILPLYLIKYKRFYKEYWIVFNIWNIIIGEIKVWNGIA